MLPMPIGLTLGSGVTPKKPTPVVMMIAKRVAVAPSKTVWARSPRP